MAICFNNRGFGVFVNIALLPLIDLYLPRMKSTTKMFIATALIVLMCALNVGELSAQGCSMCTQVADASQNEGLNKGILYIFVMPYLILGTIGFFWWRARRKAQAE